MTRFAPLLAAVLGACGMAETPVCPTTGLTSADIPCMCADAKITGGLTKEGVCKCINGQIVCDESPQDDPTSPLLATPFSAKQIRGAMPKGLEIELEIYSMGALSTKDTWKVVDTDANTVTIEYTSHSPEGQLLGTVESKKDTWVGLQKHAQFERAQATRERVAFDSALGHHDGWKYTVTVDKEGGGQELRTYWFADGLPGAPVHMAVEIEGTTVMEMKQVKRVRPLPAK